MCFHDPHRSWSNLQAYPACSPASRTPSPVIRTLHSDPGRIPAFPTMNSPAHSIPKLSMKWTPSLIHPNKSTSGELTIHVPHAVHTSETPRSRLIPSTFQNPMDLVLQAQSAQHMHITSSKLGNTKQTVKIVHQSMTPHHSRLSHTCSPKLEHRSRLG